MIICELNERQLFIKCLFPLLEKLLILKFENHLIKLENYLPQKEDLEKQVEQMKKFFDEELFKNFGIKFETLFENNKELIYSLYIFASFIYLLFGKIKEWEKYIGVLFYLYIFEVWIKIENFNSDIEQIINGLASFLMSENSLNFWYFILDRKYKIFFEGIVSICELNEKFLFLKCIITFYNDVFLSSLEVIFEKKDSSKKKFFGELNNFLSCSEEKEPIKDLLEYYNKLEVFKSFTRFISNINFHF